MKAKHHVTRLFLQGCAASVATACLLASTPAFAIDPNDPEEAEPTPTTTTCTDGKIWDETREACTDPEEAHLDDATRFAAVLELSDAGRYSEALAVLSSMVEAGSDIMLTQRGYLLRKTGNMDAAMRAYNAALALNPGNLLARSYLGQGLIEIEDFTGAASQLREIRRRGGRDTWAEVSLRLAMGAGAALEY